MRLNKILSLAAVVTLFTVASSPASAQGNLSIGFAKFGKHSAFGIGFNSGPLYYGPRRVIVDPVPCRTFVPGHYESRCVEVWVPGCCEKVWIEPCYETVVLPCGNVSRVLVREGYFKTIEKPGHFETRHVQVWVPATYV
jgi:hypothetical protein